MLLEIFYTIAGFGLLLGGADRFVAGASAAARILGMSPLVIGLTVVAFATSAPEILVSINAATSGLTGMAVGNAIGSNIANIGLVMGATALLRPLQPELGRMLRLEVWVLLLLCLVTLMLFADKSLDRLDGVLLLSGLVVFLGWMVVAGRNIQPGDTQATAASRDVPVYMSGGKASFLLLAGALVLLLGAELLVTGAEQLAKRFGLSDLTIGLTVVAIGTSLPELAVSIIGALRGKADIAVGNIVGSNVFNLLAVIGFAGLLGPGPVDATVIIVHGPIMLAFSLILLRLAYNPAGKSGIGRGTGALLLVAFMTYQYLLLSQGL